MPCFEHGERDRGQSKESKGQNEIQSFGNASTVLGTPLLGVTVGSFLQ